MPRKRGPLPMHQRLLAVREAKGVTREELARRIEMGYLRLWRLETGKIRALAEDVEQIAEGLKVDVAEIYEGRAA